MSCCDNCEYCSKCKYKDIATYCKICKVNVSEYENDYYNEDAKWDILDL